MHRCWHKKSKKPVKHRRGHEVHPKKTSMKIKLTCSGSFVFPNFKRKKTPFFLFISEVLPLDAAAPAWCITFSLSANMAELHGPTGWLFHHYQDDECVLHTESSAMKFPSSSSSSQTDSSTHISLSPNPPLRTFVR